MNQSRNNGSYSINQQPNEPRTKSALDVMTLESYQVLEQNRNHRKIDFDRLNAEQIRNKNRERLQALQQTYTNEVIDEYR